MIWKYNLQFFAEAAGDKTEEPTEKKLSDARKEGQVAKSREVVSCLSLLAVFLILKFYVSYMGGRFIDVFHEIYAMIPSTVVFWYGTMPGNDIRIVFMRMVYHVIIIMLPILGIAVLICVVCDVAQVGWKPTTKPLQPKLSRLNPISGMKKIFSANSLVELVKSIAKVGLILGVAYSYVVDNISLLFSFYHMTLLEALSNIGKLVTDLGLRISAVFAIIALADLFYQRWKFHKDMMMTKQEIKDEYKQSEGDPQIKGRIRQKMQEASRRRMMQELPKADVVITNPTHFAVAIKYDPAERDAPYVLAKGQDYMAQRIKEVARENHVEIVENKPLARTLYHNVEIGETIPPELYQAVAEVLAFVYNLQGRI
jgi:flagellar biosynthetic protein FlhB